MISHESRIAGLLSLDTPASWTIFLASGLSCRTQETLRDLREAEPNSLLSIGARTSLNNCRSGIRGDLEQAVDVIIKIVAPRRHCRIDAPANSE